MTETLTKTQCRRCNRYLTEAQVARPWRTMMGNDGPFCSELCGNRFIGDQEAGRPDTHPQNWEQAMYFPHAPEDPEFMQESIPSEILPPE